MWIFGYGSLVWRPDFPFEDRRLGYIRDWSRRFYQGSTDHRGVPGSPGRVVTLLPEPDEVVWGVAYRIEGEVRDSVLARLDHREKGGYARREIDVWSPEQVQIGTALVYIATPENPDYLGPAPMAELAEHILGAAGPSGANTEYLLNLDRALRDFDVQDDHVAELADIVRALSTQR